MTEKKRSAMASRVLRFTVTSALVVAPLAGCGGSSAESTTSTTTPEVMSNPGPEPIETNVGPQDSPVDEAPVDPGPDQPHTNSGPTSD